MDWTPKERQAAPSGVRCSCHQSRLRRCGVEEEAVGDEAAVLNLEAAHDAAWVAGDLPGLIACLDLDAIVMTPRGETLRGHSEIAQALLRTDAPGSTHTSTISR
jgi:ketosteroid isomerase-like protein